MLAKILAVTAETLGFASSGLGSVGASAFSGVSCYCVRFVVYYCSTSGSSLAVAMTVWLLSCSSYCFSLDARLALLCSMIL
jgi:hypothetical protein